MATCQGMITRVAGEDECFVHISSIYFIVTHDLVFTLIPSAITLGSATVTCYTNNKK